MWLLCCHKSLWWLTIPMNLFDCFLVFGVWMSWIACTFFGCALIPSPVTVHPRQSELVWNKWHLVKLAVKPMSSGLFNTCWSLDKWSSIVPLDVMSTSSMWTCTNSKSPNKSTMTCWKMSGAEEIPIGKCKCLHLPQGSTVVHEFWLHLSKGTWQCPVLRSMAEAHCWKTEKTASLGSPILGSISGTHWFLLVAVVCLLPPQRSSVINLNCSGSF